VSVGVHFRQLLGEYSAEFLQEFDSKFMSGMLVTEVAMTESEKRAKFVQLAEGRTQTALEAIRKLGNLSNRRAYEFTDADVRKIAKALREAVSDLEKRFGSPAEGTRNFKL
jgi:hypothetical protein